MGSTLLNQRSKPFPFSEKIHQLNWHILIFSLEYNPHENNFTQVGQTQSLFPTNLPCPIDAAVYFKKSVYVFRGCKLWSDRGEVAHLHSIGLPCNVDAAFSFRDKSVKTGRSLVKIYVVKDNRFWSSLIKVRDPFPTFKDVSAGNLNFDLDICSWSFCEKAVYTDRFGNAQDSDEYDPYEEMNINSQIFK